MNICRLDPIWSEQIGKGIDDAIRSQREWPRGRFEKGVELERCQFGRSDEIGSQLHGIIGRCSVRRSCQFFRPSAACVLTRQA
jgi:hypothetical protein